jgi:hypothetical protein
MEGNMTPEQLLQDCENLNHNRRMYRMIELGRLAASDPDVRETIEAFTRGDFYQRMLATQSCFGSHNSAQVLRALNDPSRGIRALAISLAALVCSDDELQSVLDTLPLALKESLLRHLHRQRRQRPIDAQLEALAAREDAALNNLLPYGSESVVKRHLARVIAQFTLSNWQRLARIYPSLAVEQLQARATIPGPIDPRLVLQVNAMLPILVRVAPDQALALVKTLTRVVPLTRLDLQPLAQQRPVEIADLILQANEQSRVRFGATAQNRLDDERLLALYTRYPWTVSLDDFSKLSHPKRLALYTVCARGWRDAEGILVDQIVSALPTLQRVQEGRRHLALSALTTRPIDRLRYAAFLPWDEARATFDTSLRAPDADLRGATLSALITAIRYQRDQLPNALQLIFQRRNEQDPVRGAMLRALADLPPSIWRTEHLNDLAQIIRDALNATDLSFATAQALERLIVRLLPHHPEWSALQLPQIYQTRGQVSLYHLDTLLSDADMQRIAPMLLPVLESWQTREKEEHLVLLARALGKRLRVFDGLVEILDALLDHTRSLENARNILTLFIEHRPARLAAVIPRLLEADKSYVVLQPVYAYLHRYRQDLITPFLGRIAYKGRFSTGRTRIVLSLDEGFFRWTPTQQELFALTILEVAKDKKRETYQLLSAIQQLAAMPALDPAYLIQFANDQRQPVREAALRALGTLDAGQGIPTLLEALNDDRARIAIYALRRALLTMPQDEALNILRGVPLNRVTVAKEAVRLIGDLSSEAAYQELLALDARELHRDVRVALLRALWSYLESPQTWDVFERAAQSPDPILAQSVVTIPADGLSPLASKQLVALIATVLARPEPEVRIAALNRCVEQPLTDREHTLFPQLVSALNSPLLDECRQAARAAFSLYMRDEHNATLLGEAVRLLLPNRQALSVSIERFLLALKDDRMRVLTATRAILAALAEDRLTVTLRVGLIIAGLPWSDVAPALIQLAEADELHADALGRAIYALQQACIRPEADLQALEIALAANNDVRIRRLALAALVAQSKRAEGWTDELIARLQAYQEDVSPLVAEAAQFTFVS